jgi:hypothetical protein
MLLKTIAQQRFRQPAAAWAGWLVLALSLLTAAYESAQMPLFLDAPLMHFIAQQIVDRGVVPYRDVIDMNGPVTLIVHTFLYRVFGSGDTPWQVFCFLLTLWSAGICLYLGWSAHRRRQLFLLFFVSIFIVYLAIPLFFQAGQRDWLGACLVLSAVAFVLKEPLQKQGVSWFLAGLFLGLAIGVKPNFALFCLPFLVFGASKKAPALPHHPWLRLLYWIWGVSVGCLLSFGAVEDWFEMMLYNATEYRTIGRLPLSKIFINFLWTSASAFLAASLFFILPLYRFEKSVIVFLLLLVTAGVLHYFTQGRGYEYHAFPMLLLAAASIAFSLKPPFHDGSRLALLGVLVLCLQLAVKLYDPFEERPITRHFIDARQQQITQMKQWMTSLPPEVRIQPLDTTGGVVHAMLLAGRPLASPLMYDFMLFEGSAAAQAHFRQKVWQGLTAPQSRVAIFATNEGWPFERKKNGYARHQRWPALVQLLETQYRKVQPCASRKIIRCNFTIYLPNNLEQK